MTLKAKEALQVVSIFLFNKIWNSNKIIMIGQPILLNPKCHKNIDKILSELKTNVTRTPTTTCICVSFSESGFLWSHILQRLIYICSYCAQLTVRIFSNLSYSCILLLTLVYNKLQGFVTRTTKISKKNHTDLYSHKKHFDCYEKALLLKTKKIHLIYLVLSH